MSMLKLPQQKKVIQLAENGRKYEIDITDLEVMRELSGLSRAAMRTMSGVIWTREEEHKIVSDCRDVIDRAFGNGSYCHMTQEVPALENNAVLLLGVCGQIYDISKNAVSAYINQYRKADADVADLKALLEAIVHASELLNASEGGSSA